MTNNETTEAKGFYKLSWLQRIGFGSGDLAQKGTVRLYLLPLAALGENLLRCCFQFPSLPAFLGLWPHVPPISACLLLWF